MPVRILIVIDHLAHGGAELLVKNIAENIDDEKFEVLVCALRTNPAAISIKGGVISLKYHRCDPRSVFAVADLCKKHNIDILHAHLSKSIITCLLASLICKRPVVIHEHGGIFRKGLSFSIYRFMLRLLYHRAAKIIANSQTTANKLVEVTGIETDKIEVVYNTIGFDELEVSESLRGEARKKLGILQKDIVVGFVGRLHPLKGVDILIEAFSLLLQQSADYLLVLAGDGPQRGALEVLTERLNIGERVKFLGMCDNIPEIMAAFDIGVVPSRQESFGLVAVELMRMKVPVVTSGREGLAELVNDGVTGLVTHQNVPEEICQCVQRLTEDANLRRRLTDAAYDFSNQFSLKEYLNKLRGVYVKVLGEDKSSEGSQDDFFVKKYQDRQSAEIEFNRNLEVYNIVKEEKCCYLRIPRPVRIENNIVYFERVSGCVSLRKLICSLSVNCETLFNVGKALAELHLALNPGISSLEKQMNIHGDFWAANVLYSVADNLVYVVDFAPPGFSKTGQSGYGNAYDDLAAMTISLEVKYPLYRVYLLAIRKNRELSANFLKGYEEIIGIKIDRVELMASLEKWLGTYTNVFKNKNVISRIFWTTVFRCFGRFYSKQKG